MFCFSPSQGFTDGTARLQLQLLPMEILLLPPVGRRPGPSLHKPGPSLQEIADLTCAKAHHKTLYAHGKGFAVCRTRQRAHGIQTSAKTLFAVCHLSGTRQSLCRAKTDPRQKKSKKPGK